MEAQVELWYYMTDQEEEFAKAVCVSILLINVNNVLLESFAVVIVNI
jgi:hypothetical protein